MTTRTVTGTIRRPDGTAWASGIVRFDLLTEFATATDAAVNQRVVTDTTDANGDFSVALEVPASNAWQWRCTLPDGLEFEFNLAAGSATTLHALLADANLGATVSASALATALSDKADKTVPDATNNIALLGADGNLVDSSLGTSDFYSVGGTDVAVADGGTGASTAAAARANLDALPIDAGIVAVSSSRDLLSTDNGKILEATGTITLTAPNGLDTGFQVAIVNVGSGTITIAAATTLQSKSSAVTIDTQYAAATLYHRGSNVWLLMGDIA